MCWRAGAKESRNPVKAIAHMPFICWSVPHFSNQLLQKPDCWLTSPREDARTCLPAYIQLSPSNRARSCFLRVGVENGPDKNV